MQRHRQLERCSDIHTQTELKAATRAAQTDPQTVRRCWYESQDAVVQEAQWRGAADARRTTRSQLSGQLVEDCLGSARWRRATHGAWPCAWRAASSRESVAKLRLLPSARR